MRKAKKLSSETCNNVFAQRLAGLLSANETPQKKLADHLSVTRQMVSLYANGQSVPDIDKFAKIAEFYGVSYNYLLGKSESKMSENTDIAKRLRLNDEAIRSLESFNEHDIAFINDFITFYKGRVLRTH